MIKFIKEEIKNVRGAVVLMLVLFAFLIIGETLADIAVNEVNAVQLIAAAISIIYIILFAIANRD